MPIYEFYCSDCHTIFNFLSRAINTTRRPCCPRCGKRRLERKVSAFAISRKQAAPTDEPDLPAGVDETRMEQAMAGLAREADSINEDDPRSMARLMQKFYEGAGLRMGDGMQEALRRMEAGEDPDQIEQEMGDLLEGEDPFAAAVMQNPARLRRLGRPAVDSELHEL